MGKFSLQSVVTESRPLPDRIVVYADPGWGKTTFAARMPKPIILMTPGEDRLAQLIAQGLVPPTPHFPETAQTWDDIVAAVDELIRSPHDFRTFVLDTANGSERLAQESVCDADYGGNWGESGFASFAKGERITADRHWFPFLQQLDDLRAKRRMRIVLLCHAVVRPTKNPDGPDYDKILPSMSKPSWSYTAKWADMILRGALESTAKKENPRNKIEKAKGVGGKVRLLYTSAAASFEAKNCHRLPHCIRLGDDPLRAFDAFRAAFPLPRPTNAEPVAPAAHLEPEEEPPAQEPIPA